MSYAAEELKIINWAESVGIYQHSTPTAQLLKAVSEMGELADAEAKKDLPGIRDAVGDVIVCLVNYCVLRDIDLVACLGEAVDVVTKRKGRMIEGGTFVKD